MLLRTALVLGLAVGCVAASAAKPQILIVQQQVQQFTELDPNLNLLLAFAQSLEETTWVSTILWSESNPLIVAAIADGELKSFSASPRPDDVFRLARAVRVDYVIFCSAKIEGGGVKGEMEMFRGSGGRSIFKDDSSVQIFVEGAIDKHSSILSLANTFTTRIFSGPLKDLAKLAPIQTPPPTGSAVPVTDRLPADKAPFENGMKALEGGRVMEAIALLRDAVDADPMHAQARLALIEALRRAGKPFLAADEAMRGAELNPLDLMLVVAAADCWLAGGKPDRARALAKSVLDANPSSDAAWIVYGDVCLSTVNYQEAISAYTKAIEIRPSADAYYKRAQANALVEDFPASNRDIHAAKELGLDDDPVRSLDRYRSTVRVIDNVFASLAAGVRNLLIEGRVSPGPDVSRRAAESVARISAFNDYVFKLSPPESHQRSHDQRVLALSLLLQSGLGMQKFVQGGGSEVGDEANLLHIEAMREYGAGHTLYERESTKRE